MIGFNQWESPRHHRIASLQLHYQMRAFTHKHPQMHTHVHPFAPSLITCLSSSYQMKQHGTNSDGRGVLRDHHSSVIAATLPVTVVGGKERCQHVVMAYHTLPPPPQNVVPVATAIVGATVIEHGEKL